jgi:hypothetical protein
MPSNNYIYKMSNAGGMSTVTRYTDMLAGNATFIEPAYESIATTTVGAAGVTSVSFTSIPQTYTHLQIRASVRSNSVAAYDAFYIYNLNNAGVSSLMANHYIYGGGSFVGVNAFTGQFSAQLGYVPAANTLANNFGAGIVDILDYTNTNKNKTLRGLGGFDDNGNTSGSPFITFASAYSAQLGTGAITNLTFIINNSFAIGTKFALYGIKG